MKAARNRFAFGSTAPVEAGNLVASMKPFSYTNIDIGAVQVKDQFSDHKVTQIFENLGEFPVIHEATALPETVLLGTQWLLFSMHFL